jgi:hypothetical protein
MHLEDHISDQDEMNYALQPSWRELIRISDEVPGGTINILSVPFFTGGTQKASRSHVKLQEYRLKGNRKGAVLKEETCLERGQVVGYISPTSIFGDSLETTGAYWDSTTAAAITTLTSWEGSSPSFSQPTRS